MIDLSTTNFQWCYTNGNAAQKITRFFSDLNDVEKNVDWHSIRTTDFKDNNADGDEDRKRKKHAEFLVKGYVPSKLIKRIVVYNAAAEAIVNAVLQNLDLNIEVLINPKYKFYF